MCKTNDIQLTISPSVVKLFNALEGLTLDYDDLKNIAQGEILFQTFCGCINSLGFDKNGNLNRITLNTFTDEITFSKTNILGKDAIGNLTDLSKFQVALKNAFDFGFQVCIVIKNIQQSQTSEQTSSGGSEILSVVITSRKCPVQSVAFSIPGAGRGGTSSGG